MPALGCGGGACDQRPTSTIRKRPSVPALTPRLRDRVSTRARFLRSRQTLPLHATSPRPDARYPLLLTRYLQEVQSCWRLHCVGKSRKSASWRAWPSEPVWLTLAILIVGDDAGHMRATSSRTSPTAPSRRPSR